MLQSSHFPTGNKKMIETQLCWLSQRHLELTSQWFMHNFNSPLVGSFDVVQIVFMVILDTFYIFMMYLDHNLKTAETAWNIINF